MIDLLIEAERALSVGLLDRAETLYRQVATVDPRNSIAVVGLARVALDRGDDVKALELSRRAVAIDPENPAAQRMVTRLEEIIDWRGEGAPPTEDVTQPEAEADAKAVEAMTNEGAASYGEGVETEAPTGEWTVEEVAGSEAMAPPGEDAVEAEADLAAQEPGSPDEAPASEPEPVEVEPEPSEPRDEAEPPAEEPPPQAEELAADELAAEGPQPPAQEPAPEEAPPRSFETPAPVEPPPPAPAPAATRTRAPTPEPRRRGFLDRLFRRSG